MTDSIQFNKKIRDLIKYIDRYKINITKTTTIEQITIVYMVNIKILLGHHYYYFNYD